ncbi:ArnT family glycosyltransferase [Hyphomonas pacifica]|uniref:ArnT family glycosyltransferase n=1 Tax=Hyphomonas pacifica TaxID=1280941 RepID=UPI000DC01EC9|nr:glycosyltransferase family 39 protein [Hyphomonas pacifica]RAN37848.1 hypothetical protein HY11_08155 [Hyphomonas pacifica]
MTDHTADSPDNWRSFTFFALIALLVVRVVFNAASPLDLYADEAQYWRWGHTLDWGYYSKPPMIAWIIHAFTAVFGNAEWAIRLPAAFLHTIGAFIIYFLGRDMYGARTGMFASIGYALMPAVILSSAIISTDGVLMPFWCAALWALWRLRSGTGSWASAIGLGAAVGLGFLSKYAMVYFLIGTALILIIDADSRRALLTWKGLAALLTGLTIFAPHLAWNAANDFKTVSHTVDNANLGGDLLNPEHALTFLVDQLGVFGPISFLALIFGVFVMRTQDQGIMGRDRWLLCFILPVLLIILAQAVLSRANANWAATAYPGASVLVAAWLTRARPNRSLWYWIAGICFTAFLFAPDMSLIAKLAIGTVTALSILGFDHIVKHAPSGLLWTSLTLHTVLAISFMTIALLPASTSTALGFDNALKRTRGWEQTAEQVFSRAQDIGATAVLVDEREVWHGLDYYARERATPLISWRRYAGPKSFSESVPLEGPMAQRVLVVSKHASMRPRLRGDFQTFESLGDITIPLGTRSNGCPIVRRFQLYLGTGYQPQARTQEWEDRYDGQSEFEAPPCPAKDD